MHIFFLSTQEDCLKFRVRHSFSGSMKRSSILCLQSYHWRSSILSLELHKNVYSKLSSTKDGFTLGTIKQFKSRLTQIETDKTMNIKFRYYVFCQGQYTRDDKKIEASSHNLNKASLWHAMHTCSSELHIFVNEFAENVSFLSQGLVHVCVHITAQPLHYIALFTQHSAIQKTELKRLHFVSAEKKWQTRKTKEKQKN